MGFLGMMDSNLKGYGAGSFLVEAPSVYDRHGLGTALGLQGYYASAVPASLSAWPLSHFAVIVLEYGIVGIIFLIVLFTFAARSKIPHKAIAVTTLIATWVQAFPAAWPLFWVLIGIMMSPHFRSKRSPRTAESAEAIASALPPGTR